MRCPGKGLASNAPKGVKTTLRRVRSVANAGRSRKSVSPLLSTPVVMLKGSPDRHRTRGVKSNAPFNLIHPPPVHRVPRVQNRAAIIRLEIVAVARKTIWSLRVVLGVAPGVG